MPMMYKSYYKTIKTRNTYVMDVELKRGRGVSAFPVNHTGKWAWHERTSTYEKFDI